MPAHNEHRNSIRPTILRCFTAQPGAVLWVMDVVEQTGLTRRQVTNCMASFYLSNDALKDDVECVVRGNAWRYRPHAAPTTVANARPAGDAPTDTESTTESTTGSTTSSTRRSTRRGRVAATKTIIDDQPTILEVVSPLANGDVLVRGDNDRFYRVRLEVIT